jgi:carboxymethylenebutenolidase
MQLRLGREHMAAIRRALPRQGFTWLYATHNPKLRAATAWYGPLASKDTEITPKSPIELAGQLKAPVLGLYGGLDQGITADAVAAMRVALKNAPTVASDSHIVVYPDAQHGFNADYRPSYNREDAVNGWALMLEWFASHGVR